MQIVDAKLTSVVSLLLTLIAKKKSPRKGRMTRSAILLGKDSRVDGAFVGLDKKLQTFTRTFSFSLFLLCFVLLYSLLFASDSGTESILSSAVVKSDETVATI